MAKWVGGLANKFDWDITFLAEAFIISQRSIDPRTNHGACLVSKDYRILSKGYNGPIKNTNDIINNETMITDEKYHIVIHAEENCILNYHGNQFDLIDSTIYMTGEPCFRCLKMILQKGIKRIVHGHVCSKCIDRDDAHAKKLILESLNDPIEIVTMDSDDINSVKNLLIKTINYIDYKL